MGHWVCKKNPWNLLFPFHHTLGWIQNRGSVVRVDSGRNRRWRGERGGGARGGHGLPQGGFGAWVGARRGVLRGLGASAAAVGAGGGGSVIWMAGNGLERFPVAGGNS